MKTYQEPISTLIANLRKFLAQCPATTAEYIIKISELERLFNHIEALEEIRNKLLPELSTCVRQMNERGEQLASFCDKIIGENARDEAPGE